MNLNINITNYVFKLCCSVQPDLKCHYIILKLTDNKMHGTFFYHNVVGIHGLDSIQELELYLLIVPIVLKGEELNAIL